MSGGARRTTREVHTVSDDDGHAADGEFEYHGSGSDYEDKGPKPNRVGAMGKKSVPAAPKRIPLTAALSTGAQTSKPAKPDPAETPTTGWKSLANKNEEFATRAPDKGAKPASKRAKGSQEPVGEQAANTAAMMLTGFNPNKPADATQTKQEPLPRFRKLSQEGGTVSGSNEEGSSVTRNVDQFIDRSKRKSISPAPPGANQKKGSKHVRYHSSGDELAQAASETEGLGKARRVSEKAAGTDTGTVLVRDSDEEDDIARYKSSSPLLKKKARYGE
jgi:hypothetical protein